MSLPVNRAANEPPDRRDEDLRLLGWAIEQLTKKLSHGRAAKLLVDLRECLLAIAAGRQFTTPKLIVVALSIAHQYLCFRTPLYFDDRLYDEFMAQEDVEARECGNVLCGYRQPAGHATCVLCGSATGDMGIFEKNRKRAARRAAVN